MSDSCVVDTFDDWDFEEEEAGARFSGVEQYTDTNKANNGVDDWDDELPQPVSSSTNKTIGWSDEENEKSPSDYEGRKDGRGQFSDRGARSSAGRGGGRGGRRGGGRGSEHGGGDRRNGEAAHRNLNGGYRGKRDDTNNGRDEVRKFGNSGRNGDGGGYSGNRAGRREYQNSGNKEMKRDMDSEKKKDFYIPPEPTDDENEMFSQGISSGINFNKYDSIPVEVSGNNPPKPIDNFESANLKELVLENIKKSGYRRPTPIQKNAIPTIKAGRDLMGCAQTGSGKTAAYLLPIINNLLESKKGLSVGKPHVLIISPTRELSIQIFEQARKFAHGSYLKISIVYGGTGVKHQMDNMGNPCHILVATVGRLLDFFERGLINFEDLEVVVLDEADRMLEMGFFPSVEKIMKDSTFPKQGARQTLMFSATFPREIQELARKFLKNYIFLTIGIVGSACRDVEQLFIEVKKFDKRAKLMDILTENENNVKGTMVFVETQRNADFLASLLSETKFPTTSIHGARLQRERETALRDFKSGKMSVLIATSVAARGLDIKNVDHVINYDLPQSVDEYVHRIGRTGRVGNKGKATSFFDPKQDQSLANGLVKILKQAKQVVPEFLENACCIGNVGCYGSNDFGGRDVRKVNMQTGSVSAVPLPQEPEEEW